VTRTPAPVALTKKVAEALAFVGVPDMTPLSSSIDRPDGKEGLTLY
jgi:hypothetical protein